MFKERFRSTGQLKGNVISLNDAIESAQIALSCF